MKSIFSVNPCLSSVYSYSKCSFLDDDSYEDKIKDKYLSIPSYVKNLFIFLGAFSFIFVLYFCLKPFYKVGGIENGVIARSFEAFILVGIILSGLILKIKKRLTFNRFIILILTLSLTISLFYMLVTPYNVRQHDTVSTNNDGHMDYALSFYYYMRLPNHHNDINTVYQFYHPPLNAFIQGLFMRFVDGFAYLVLPVYDINTLYETTQILSCFYSFLISFYLIKIVCLFNFKRTSKVLLISLLALFPRIFNFAALLNNDCLSTMLVIAATYYFLKFYFKDHKYFDLLLVGVLIGLAMMTKLSAALIAIPIGVFMIVYFVKVCLTKNVKNILICTGVYLLFLIVCATLGLWFQIYSVKVLNLPFGYVFNRLNPALLVSQFSFFQRFIIPISFHDLLNNTYCFIGGENTDYNLFTYSIKSALFGEFRYFNGSFLTPLMLLNSYVLLICIAIMSLYRIIKDRRIHSDVGIFMLVMSLTYIIGQIYFNIKMPYVCTMDFRYIVPIIIPVGFQIGFNNDYFENSILDSKELAFKKSMICISKTSVSMFVCLSCLFYILCI